MQISARLWMKWRSRWEHGCTDSRRAKPGGRLEIEYYSQDDLDRIYSHDRETEKLVPAAGVEPATYGL